MAKFHNPSQNPFTDPKPIGTGSIKSRYLFNNYRLEWDVARWREAIDQAQQYSNLVYLDTLYSWVLQSSPFLLSQLNKRIVPILKRNYALAINGNIDDDLTDKYIKNSWWFKKYARYVVLAQFYGVKVFSINPKSREVIDFPLRNIDIINRGLREMTYQYNEMIDAEDYDNLFYIQPNDDQDFRLGLLQPISRAMIGMVEQFNNWFIASKSFSRPMVHLGYDANNTEAQETAINVAENFDMFTTPIIPFRSDYNQQGKSLYSVEINTTPTQASPEAFRMFKEYIIEYRSEIMQLVTGGTLLGATEKNTNSEQLASIHWDIYQDILDADSELVVNTYNDIVNRAKISRLFGDSRLQKAELVELPPAKIDLKTFIEAGTVISKQNGRFTPEAFEKIGLSKDDIQFEQPKTSILGTITSKKNKKTPNE